MNNMKLTKIAYETIYTSKDGITYSWGKYGDFKVIINNYGYINATHLCGLTTTKNGNKKEFRTWMQTTQSKEMIEKLSSSVRILTDEIIIQPTNLPNEIRGTYVHPKLIPHIASWASVEFAFKVSDIINNYFIVKAIKEKDTVIESLEEKIDNQTKEIQKLLGYARETANELGETKEILGNTNEEIIETRANLKETKKEVKKIAIKLDVATEDRSPKTKSSSILEYFELYNKPNTTLYKSIRVQKRGLSTARKRLVRQGFINQFYSGYEPNSVNTWNRIKEKLRKDDTKATLVRGKPFIIQCKTSKDDFYDFIDAIHKEKKEV
jgi:hypothetical protein